MKATSIVFTAARTVALEEVEVSDPGEREMTVETLVTLMSIGTELTCYRGESDEGSHWHGWVKYPFHPGYSAVGRVVKAGSRVSEFAEGDRVFACVNHRSAANVSADWGNVVKIPEGVSNEEAAWCKLATITQTGVRQMEHSMGETAVVIGLGPLGQLITQYCRLLGLREILAIDTIQARLDRALAHGATAAFRGAVEDARDFVLERTGGDLADAVYDVTGHYAVFPVALTLAKRFGKVLLQGDSPHPSKQHLTPDVLTRQLRVLGTHNENLPPQHAFWTARRQSELFYTYLQRGQMRVGDMISSRHRPEDAPRVYAGLQADRKDSAGELFVWQ